MKKFLSTICLVLILTIVASAVAFAACDGKGRSYKVECYKTFGKYQYGKATHSAECTSGHSVTLDTSLTLYYTDGTNSGAIPGTSSVKKQVPAGKVGESASGVFNAKCSGYNFPERSATDSW